MALFTAENWCSRLKIVNQFANIAKMCYNENILHPVLLMNAD